MLEIHPDARKNFDAKAAQLAASLAPEAVPKNPSRAFPAGLPYIAARLGPEDIADDDMSWSHTDQLGIETARFFTAGGVVLGISGERYENLRALADSMLRTPALRERVSSAAVVSAITDWFRARYLSETEAPMSEHVLAKLEREIQSLTVLFPLHELFVEVPLQIGRATIRPVSREEATHWFTEYADEHSMKPEHRERMLRTWLQRLQARAAAECHFVAEPGYAVEQGQKQAEHAVALLRIFSPGCLHPRLRTDAVLLGQEPSIGRFHVMLMGNRMLTAHEGMVITPGIASWSIRRNPLERIRELALDSMSNLLALTRGLSFKTAS